MVQIRREAVYGRTRALSSSLWGFLRVALLSAAIPLLFVLRFTLNGRFFHTVNPTSSSATGDTNKAALRVFDFLHDLDLTVPHNLHGSDVVELHHCDLTALDWSNFTAWAFPLLNQSVEALKKTQDFLAYQQNKQQLLIDMQQEFVLELLEQYASEWQLCDYSLYRPTVYGHETQGLQLQRLREQDDYSHDDHDLSPDHQHGSTRLVFVMIAYQDIQQLTDLVNAVYMPQHYIIIHLERRCPQQFQQQVLELAGLHPNVVVLQFGTITYRTDSVSLVNLRIIRWLTLDLELAYDYLVLLDGASFPLVSARELTRSLAQSERDVWLGELTQKGQSVVNHPADQYLRHKRLWLTLRDYPKLHKRLPMTPTSVLSDTIQSSFMYKTNSGNQGIYSHHVIHQLLGSDTVMEIFALSKYGCCCCVEEHNWIAALAVIGYHEEALEQASMFQLWGGSEECQSSMNNALLLRNASLCYRFEDPSATSMYFRGNELMSHLSNARRRGFLFARKFSSDSLESKRLMADIQRDFWDA